MHHCPLYYLENVDNKHNYNDDDTNTFLGVCVSNLLLPVSMDTCVVAMVTGEHCEVQLEVYVDKMTAPDLNTSRKKLDDILVLHLEGGKDLFVSMVTWSHREHCVHDCTM